jgi:SET domain-containing protein
VSKPIKLTIANSHIHGRGLFAATAIRKGATLGICATSKTQDPGEHTLWLDEGPVDVTCDLRFINHSKSPNVAYYDDLSVVALRHIRRGEELTHDYGSDWT